MTAAEILAAFTAASAAKPTKINIPGIGECYTRAATVSDIDEARVIADERKASGKTEHRFAIGLAQTICTETGEPVFDPRNDGHLSTLAKLPWGKVEKLLRADAEKND